MKYEDMSFTIPECGLLQSHRVYLYEGEVCECTISGDRKDYWLDNLKTGESKKLDGLMAVLLEGQIRDITDAYIRENPDYAQDRMERRGKICDREKITTRRVISWSLWQTAAIRKPSICWPTVSTRHLIICGRRTV